MTSPCGIHPVADWPRPLAFVLSGGGSYGAAQVGMLQALEDASIVPDLVVGSSVGALNGAMVATRPKGSAQRLSEAWKPMTRRKLFGGGGAVTTTVRFLRWRKSLCPPTGLASLVDEWLTVDRFDQLALPLSVMATDTETGDTTPLSDGPLAPALMASAAIPGVFPAVEIGDRFYIDGGVSANVPVRQAIAAGANSVVVLNANPATMVGKRPTTIIGSLMHASTVMLRSQRADAVDDLASRYRILNLPQVTPASLNSFDFTHTEALIASGRQRTEQLLASMAATPASDRS